MDVREKLVEILRKPIFPHELVDPIEAVADYLLDSGVTVQDVPDTNVGEWIKNGWNNYSCSVCGCQLIGHGASHWKYCPHCGAKMMPQPPKGE